MRPVLSLHSNSWIKQQTASLPVTESRHFLKRRTHVGHVRFFHWISITITISQHSRAFTNGAAIATSRDQGHSPSLIPRRDEHYWFSIGNCRRRKGTVWAAFTPESCTRVSMNSKTQKPPACDLLSTCPSAETMDSVHSIQLRRTDASRRCTCSSRGQTPMTGYDFPLFFYIISYIIYTSCVV